MALLRKLVFLSLVSGSAIAFAEPPSGYYATAEGKAGSELRQALHDIIHNHAVVSENNTVEAIALLDANPADTNYVIEIYSGSNAPASLYGPTNGWNREHQWCESYGIEYQPANSDLHNLRAIDPNVNSSRGNKHYDWSNPIEGYHNPAHVEAPLCTSDSNSWELPLFEQGNVARVLFYMATRYTGDVAGVAGEPQLILTDNVALITSTNHYMGKLRTLLEWHNADPVDAAEGLRNDRIYSLYQHNRNPFIDHPEWVNLAFSPVHTNPPVLNIAPSSNLIVLSWLTTNQSSHLEFSTNAGLGWFHLTNTPSLSNAQFRVAMTNSVPSMWFRLRVSSE